MGMYESNDKKIITNRIQIFKMDKILRLYTIFFFFLIVFIIEISVLSTKYEVYDSKELRLNPVVQTVIVSTLAVFVVTMVCCAMDKKIFCGLKNLHSKRQNDDERMNLIKSNEDDHNDCDNQRQKELNCQSQNQSENGSQNQLQNQLKMNDLGESTSSYANTTGYFY